MIAHVIIICLLLIDISVSACVLCKMVPSAADKLDAEVERAQEERNLIEEGFENIMTYSVMGKTGFERWGERE